MADVSISQAAKLAGISRSHLYEKYIKAGKLTVSTGDDSKKHVDTSELLRVFGTLKGLDSEDSHQDGTKDRSGHLEGEAKDRYGQQLHASLKLVLEEKDKHIQSLQSQLEDARQREQWLQDQVKTATRLLEHKPPAPQQDPATLAALKDERQNSQALQERMADLERVVVEQGEARLQSDRERDESSKAAQQAVCEVIRLAEELEKEKHISILTKFLDNVMGRKR